MPTPPSGDIACAASPMHSNPSVCQRRSRFTRTSRCLTSSMDSSAATDSGMSGSSAPTSRRKASTPRAQLGVAALGPQVGDLVVALARDDGQRLARPDARQERVVRGAVAWQLEPPHVEVHRVFVGGESGLLPHDRPAAVAGHRQLGPEFARPVGSVVAHAHDPAAVAQQAGDLAAHPQGETRFGPGRLGEQVEQVPLRDHGDVAMGLAEPFEVEVGDRVPVGFEGAPAEFAERQSREPLPRPSSSSSRSVVGCTVSPRKSRRKSPCFSSRVTSTPARASNSPRTIPAGPPPTTAQVVVSTINAPA